MSSFDGTWIRVNMGARIACPTLAPSTHKGGCTCYQQNTRACVPTYPHVYEHSFASTGHHVSFRRGWRAWVWGLVIPLQDLRRFKSCFRGLWAPVYSGTGSKAILPRSSIEKPSLADVVERNDARRQFCFVVPEGGSGEQPYLGYEASLLMNRRASGRGECESLPSVNRPPLLRCQRGGWFGTTLRRYAARVK